jgi:nucleotide-binding universal stress UspA family protein
MGRIRRIVHPSDFSRASNAAFGKAVEMAKANRAELLLVHVLVPFVPAMGGDGYVSPQVYAEIEASSNAYARKELDALAAKAKKSGVRTSVLVSEGAPAERIAHLARSKRADVVVLGTHGRTGLARMFLGSVASRVISIATCPVLTVRGK